MVINDLSDIKQKVFTFKHSINRGIDSSPSKISMRDSVVIHTTVANMYIFNKIVCDLQFHTNDFSIIWSINYNASVI